MSSNKNRFPSYRSTYNNNNINTSSHSYTDSTMDVSLRSHQNFLQSRDKALDLESDEWPAPMSLEDDDEIGIISTYFMFLLM